MTNRQKLDTIYDELLHFAFTADPTDKADVMVKRERVLILRIAQLCAPTDRSQP